MQSPASIELMLAYATLAKSYDARVVAADHDPRWSPEDDRELTADLGRMGAMWAQIEPLIPTLDPAWLARCKAALEALPDKLAANVALYDWPNRIPEGVRLLTQHHALPPLL